MIIIEHDAAKGFFFAMEDGKEIGSLEYELFARTMTITHTRAYVQGRGLGRILVDAAIEYARSQGMKIIPLCSYAKALMGGVEEYRDMIQKHVE